MRILLIVLAIAGIIAALSVAAVYSYGKFAERSLGPPSTALPVAPADTTLDRAATALFAGRTDESGLLMLSNSYDAFAARVLVTRAAGRSLDLMYYIWERDLTGHLLAEEVLKAADRGVRVRLLLDDFTTHGGVAPYLALDSHENIEVRMFNPTRARENAFRRGLEMLLRFFSTTRRMHNKAWIADARVAIVGGRNIGDDYFDATDNNNFRALDVMAIGPAATEAETIFDGFWNSRVVLPIEALAGNREPDLPEFRAQVAATAISAAAKPYLDRVRERTSFVAGFANPEALRWSEDVTVYSDPPEKAFGEDGDNWLIETLGRVMNTAEHSLEIISPYCVPGVAGTEGLTGIAKRGVDVQVLTNSLAATDFFPTGFSGYANYRDALLSGGVKLYELMPQQERSYTLLFGASKLSLHTKAFAVDDATGFIGSFNFDLRSAHLNTEMGIRFHDARMVSELRALFAEQIEPETSYSVSLDGAGALRWQGAPNGTEETYDHDPDTSPFRRFVVWVLRKLPIESQL